MASRVARAWRADPQDGLDVRSGYLVRADTEEFPLIRCGQRLACWKLLFSSFADVTDLTVLVG